MEIFHITFLAFRLLCINLVKCIAWYGCNFDCKFEEALYLRINRMSILYFICLSLRLRFVVFRLVIDKCLWPA